MRPQTEDVTSILTAWAATEWRTLHQAVVSPADSNMKCQEERYAGPGGTWILTGHIAVVDCGGQLTCNTDRRLETLVQIQTAHLQHRQDIRDMSANTGSSLAAQTRYWRH
jgi:hypothetical protein